MPSDPDLRRKLAKEGRLWALAFVCAVVGATTVAVTDAVPPGVLAFLVALAVLAPALYLYERRRRT
jgi:Flp pilus assembly protein TadB